FPSISSPGRCRARTPSCAGSAGRSSGSPFGSWRTASRGVGAFASTERWGGEPMRFRVARSAFRVLAAFWRLNLAEELQYRANFIASLAGTVFDIATALLGLALAGYALFRMGHTPSLAQLAAFALTLAAAAVVVYAIWVVLMSLAFWFVSVENIAVLFDAVYEGARYPVSAYPGALRFVFVYLIPIAWTTTIPASALTGRLRPEIALAAALVAALAFAL